MLQRKKNNEDCYARNFDQLRAKGYTKTIRTTTKDVALAQTYVKRFSAFLYLMSMNPYRANKMLSFWQ